MPFVNTSLGRVHYAVSGSGPVVVLLHGFLEHMAMWDFVLDKLELANTVIRVDLCGHGRSPVLKGKPEVSAMARAVFELLQNLRVEEYSLIGHSMGGYVSLELLKINEIKVQALIMYHSTAAADTPEKRENRNRAMQLVSKNKQAFLAAAIPQLFYSENLRRYPEEVELAIAQAAATSKAGALYCLQAMRDRNDNKALVAKNKDKIFYLMGDNDPVLPMSFMQEELGLLKSGSWFVIPDCGHMSHLERRKQARFQLCVAMIDLIPEG